MSFEKVKSVKLSIDILAKKILLSLNMPLDTFKLPKPDVRLVMLEDTVYKVKLNLRKVRQSSRYLYKTMSEKTQDI